MKIFAKGIVADTLTLTCNGTEVLKIAYRFNAEIHWAEVMKIRLDMAKEAEKKHPNNEYIGQKVLALFELVFGSEATKCMMDFFENSLECLITNISPVFQYKIYTACEKARKRAIRARKAAK